MDFLTELEDLGDKNEDIKWIGYSTVISILSVSFDLLIKHLLVLI